MDVGNFLVQAPCPVQVNVTYHVAMVYNGSTLSLYRNGVLVGQIPASGNLIQNNLIATIGLYSTPGWPESFEGYINEVRIWNVARSQAQIQANISPTPIASVDSTTTYIVKGIGDNGCYAYDTVAVNVTATGANTFVVPNAFTPNGDGHNDCFGVTRWRRSPGRVW